MSTQRKDEDRMMSDSEFRVIADSNNIPGVSIEKDGVHDEGAATAGGL